MRKSEIFSIAFSALIFSTHGCASTTLPSYQDTQQGGASASYQLAQGYGGRGYDSGGGGEGMARQVCTAINRNNDHRFTGRSQSYPRGNELGDTAREEACSKAKLRCLKDSPGAPCECIPKRIDRGGSCERVDAY